MRSEYQVAVIGAGPGGYSAAFLAAGQGLSTVLIDPESAPGGVCLHRGCIPSKALLHAARVITESREAGRMGIHFPAPTIDLERLRAWKTEIVTRLTTGLAQQCQLRGVTLVRGRASLLDPNHLRIEHPPSEPIQIRAGHIILATGSRPATLPDVDASLAGVMDSTTALSLEKIPASLLVVGAGNIGLELGTVYAALGAQVHVVEAGTGILPGTDRDLVRPLAARLGKTLASLTMNARLERVESISEGVRVTLTDGSGNRIVHDVEQMLIATGRTPASDIPGLERTRVTRDGRGAIQVDGSLRTAEPTILAIGDVTGGPMLAHRASAQARVAIATLCGAPPPERLPILPGVTYTDPEVAWAGLTETVAREQGIPVRAVRFPWAASGRAHTLERTEGVTKWILEPDSGRILGVGITGPGAGELIAEGILAMEHGLTIDRIAHCVHPHPTLSETMMEAAEIFSGSSIHFHAPRRDPRGAPPHR
ncbi:Dihydrolipoyl dehydrogenase [Candidatus Magnetaquicoccaceae bacterium FCR-1]|uniref:Dihydrolipoyl dehydrogenase n=1 Tax=Candidatus Magnetaquiglobus chichijimensis TaxID=3141448 RepID=A0ABQ0C8A7_9PROT